MQDMRTRIPKNSFEPIPPRTHMNKSLLLASLVACVALAACGDKKPAPAPAPAAAPAAATAPAAAASDAAPAAAATAPAAAASK